jgi:nucleotide-binding universal stress UspA family protein
MKLLIAYDGSGCAEAAIDDLRRAGLPSEGEAQIISVAEVWLPPPDAVDDPAERSSPYIEELVRSHRERGERALCEASIRAKHAEARVRTALPGWTVMSSATYGSPAWEILAAAKTAQPDLIIVGSHGHSVLGRFFLGSISQKILTEAHCTVRVSRGRNEVDPGSGRIVIGFDGSRGASAAVDAVASRCWRPGTEVRLLAATEVVTPSTIARFVPPVVKLVEEVNQSEKLWMRQLAEPALSRLTGCGVKTDLRIRSGNPKELLIQEAEQWGADCIFVGANAYGSRLERVLLGSTSAAVAARAHCSVEVVRVRSTGL